MIPDGLLDAPNLDAEMRAMAEMAVAGLSQRLARPEAEMDPAEEAADAADGARESEDGVRETSVAALPPPAVVEPPRYNPPSPFRLSFTFGSDGGYSGVEMADPTFAWLESGAVTMKTASVGQLSTSGTVYLNVTLDSHGAFSSAEVSMSRSGSLSVPLYELDASKGVVKDYRHALVVLGNIGGGGGFDPSTLFDVTYLDDVTWDPSYHRLVKHWVTKNIATGDVTPIAGAPDGKTATIETTAISDII